MIHLVYSAEPTHCACDAWVSEVGGWTEDPWDVECIECLRRHIGKLEVELEEAKETER